MSICMGPPASQPNDGHHGHGAVVVELVAHLEHVSTWNTCRYLGRYLCDQFMYFSAVKINV